MLTDDMAPHIKPSSTPSCAAAIHLGFHVFIMIQILVHFSSALAAWYCEQALAMQMGK
jgi:hypothetical protein